MRSIAFAAAVAAIGALALTTPARADQIFDWSGACTLGCTGTASGVLTLANGATPLAFSVADFISFEFTSSSGTFTLDNASPFLGAQGTSGGPGCNEAGCGSLLLEENALGPSTLPLWQFLYATDPLPVTLSLDPGAWQFLSGSSQWECLDALCTTWTDNVSRNVGADGVFTRREAVAPVPFAGAGEGLPGLALAFLTWLQLRRKRGARSPAPPSSIRSSAP
jgi:hypothetical protein